MQDMSCRIMCALLLGSAFAVGALGAPAKRTTYQKLFRLGYIEGFKDVAYTRCGNPIRLRDATPESCAGAPPATGIGPDEGAVR